MPETSRKRIVINLDEKQNARTVSSGDRRRRWPKVLAVLGIVVVTIAVLAATGIFFWWQHYKTTPAYSLALVINAAQRNDMTTFDQMVDTDKIVDSLATQLAEKAAGRYGTTLTPLLRQRVEALLPSLLPGVKQGLRVELAENVQEIAQSLEGKPFLVAAITLPYFVNVTTEGDTAGVAVTVRDRPTELTMQRNGERWNIVAIKDDTIVQRLVDNLTKDLPAIGQLFNELQPDDQFGRLPGSRKRLGKRR